MLLVASTVELACGATISEACGRAVLSSHYHPSFHKGWQSLGTSPSLGCLSAPKDRPSTAGTAHGHCPNTQDACHDYVNSHTSLTETPKRPIHTAAEAQIFAQPQQCFAV